MDAVTKIQRRLLHALTLLGATPSHIADEARAPVADVLRWLDGEDMPEDKLERLRIGAAFYLHHEATRLGETLVEIPTVLEHSAPGKRFRDEIDRINQAHWLLYGHFFLEWIRLHDLPDEASYDGNW